MLGGEGFFFAAGILDDGLERSSSSAASSLDDFKFAFDFLAVLVLIVLARIEARISSTVLRKREPDLRGRSELRDFEFGSGWGDFGEGVNAECATLEKPVRGSSLGTGKGLNRCFSGIIAQSL